MPSQPAESQNPKRASSPTGSLGPPRKESIFTPFLSLDRRIWLIALARLINTMGFSLVMPFIAIYLVEERGATGAAYGAIYLLSGLFSAVGQGIAGELSDRIGRRGVMVSGLASRTVNMVALGLAVLYAAPIWVLGALVVLNGLLRAQFEPAAGAAVTELSPPHLRVAAFGLQRIGVNLGWAVGPALGGMLSSHSYGTMFFVAAPATLIAIFAVLPLGRQKIEREAPRIKEKLSVSQVLGTLREHRVFASYLVLVLFGSILTVQIFSTLAVYSTTQLGLTKLDVGLLYTVNGVMVVAIQVPAVALARWWGMRQALVFGTILYAVGYLIFGFSTGFAPLAMGMAILTAGEVIFAPALSDTAATLGDPERLGRAFGLFGTVQSVGLSLGPLVGGLAFDSLQHHPLGLWGTMGAGMLVLGVAYSIFGRVTGAFDRMGQQKMSPGGA